MIQRFRKHQLPHTEYVVLDTSFCQACWKCMNVCGNDVFGKINLPWHKHIRFVNIHACVGCMKCVKVCEVKAITKINNK